jgi:small-conductance mechanosensitive channel
MIGRRSRKPRLICMAITNTIEKEEQQLEKAEEERIEQVAEEQKRKPAAEVREQLEEVRKALKRTPRQEEVAPPVTKARDRVWFGGYVLLLIGFGVLYYLLKLNALPLSDEIVATSQRYTKAAIFLVLVLGIAKASEVYFIGRIEDAVSKYNLIRIQRLIVILALTFIVISALFVTWYTVVVSVGLISLILGFALHTPITSFIGWIYLMVKAPYRVGDRVKIGEAAGDVIDVGYLDTTLWEFGGKYLSGDHPSGRIIKFPNSKVLEETVYNYSSPLFPYLWNEIKINVSYESDLEYVAKMMQEVTEEEVGEGMKRRVGVYRRVLAKTPINELEVRERPSVVFRVSENTWVEAIVRYLVHPRTAGSVKTRLIKKLLEKMNAAPDRVMFPKGNAR